MWIGIVLVLIGTVLISPAYNQSLNFALSILIVVTANVGCLYNTLSHFSAIQECCQQRITLQMGLQK